MKFINIFAFVILAVVAASCSAGNVFSLEVGLCFDDDPDLVSEGGDEPVEITDVPIVDCDGDHDNEVFFTYDLPDGDFPGDAAISDSATERCVAEFDDYVGSDLQTSILDLSWLSPTNESWDNDDREVACILFDAQFQKLSGSAKGSGL